MKKIVLAFLLVACLLIMGCIVEGEDSGINTIQGLSGTGADRSPKDEKESEEILNSALSHIGNDINSRSTSSGNRSVTNIDIADNNISINETGFKLSVNVLGDLYVDAGLINNIESINDDLGILTNILFLNQEFDPLLTAEIRGSLNADIFERVYSEDNYSLKISGTIIGSGIVDSSVSVKTEVLNNYAEINLSAQISLDLVLSVLRTDNLNGDTVGAKYYLSTSESVNIQDFQLDNTNTAVFLSMFSDIDIDVNVYNDDNVLINTYIYNGETIISSLLNI